MDSTEQPSTPHQHGTSHHSASHHHSSTHHRHHVDRHRWEMRLGSQLGNAARMLFCAALVILPFFWGGRHPMAAGFAGFAACAVLMLWGASALVGGAVSFKKPTGLLLLVAVLAIALLQLSPGFSRAVMGVDLAHIWKTALAGGGTDLEPTLASMPGLQATKIAALGAIAVLYWLAWQLFGGSRKTLLVLAATVSATGLASAAAGLIAHFGGFDWVFWVYKEPEALVSGPYFNKNHFAQLMSMSMLVSAGLLACTAAHNPQHWTVKNLTAWQRRGLAALAGASLIICALGLAFSGSRTGTMTGLAAIGIFAGILAVRRAPGFAPAIALLVLAVAAASFYGLDRIYSRIEFGLSGEDASGLARLEMWKTALQVIALSPWFGSGFDGMRALSGHFDTSYMPGFLTFDAHNDYLDLPLMFGIPVAAAVFAFGAFKFVQCALALAGHRVRISSLQPIALGALLGMAAAAGHEVMDYGLKQPANLLVFLALAVIVGGILRSLRETEPRPVWYLSRTLYALPVVLAVPLAAALWVSVSHWDEGVALAALTDARSVPAMRRALTPQVRAETILARSHALEAANPTRIEAYDDAGDAHLMLATALQTEAMAKAMSHVLDRSVSPEQVWREAYLNYRQQAFEEIPEQTRTAIAAEYQAAARSFEKSAAVNPLLGLPVSSAAHALDEANGWSLTEGSHLALHRKALAIEPTLTDVLWNALNGYWRAWQEAGSKERMPLADEMVRLAESFGRQLPYQMNRIYPIIASVVPDTALLVRMTPDNIGGQEQLGRYMAATGHFDIAVRAFSRVLELNAARPEEETPETLGNVGFMQRDRRTKTLLERQTRQRLAAALKADGKAEEADSQLALVTGLKQVERTPLIERVDKLLATGNYTLAEQALKSARDDVRAQVRLAGIYLAEGRYEALRRCVAALQEADDLDADSRAKLDDIAARMKSQGLSIPATPVTGAP